MAGARPARRAEVYAGRDAARAALASLGVAAGAIGRRPDRSPDWPAGVIGSLTHTRGLAAAMVACSTRRHPHPRPVPSSDPSRPGLGIDAEVDRPLPPGVAERVMQPPERAALGAEAEVDGVVVFSAKESVFKALNPLTGRWLEFEDVVIHLEAEDQARSRGAFEAWLSTDGRRPGDPAAVTGAWRRAGGVVVTGCVLSTVATGPR